MIYEITAKRIQDISIVSSIKPNFNDTFFVYLCVLYISKHKIVFNLICRTDKTIPGLYKTRKSTNNQLSNFGLIEATMDLSRILLAVSGKPPQNQLYFTGS